MTIESWQLWALLSAVFAALTAIFARIGVENIGSDLATFIRTVVVLKLPHLAACHRPVRDVASDLATNLDFSHSLGPRDGSFLALLLPRTQAWLRFDGRTDRQIERRACRSLCIRIPRRASLSNGMDGHRSDSSRRSDHRHQGLTTHAGSPDAVASIKAAVSWCSQPST